VSFSCWDLWLTTWDALATKKKKKLKPTHRCILYRAFKAYIESHCTAFVPYRTVAASVIGRFTKLSQTATEVRTKGQITRLTNFYEKRGSSFVWQAGTSVLSAASALLLLSHSHTHTLPHTHTLCECHAPAWGGQDTPSLTR
jgi:hypothetical protein